MVLLSSSSSSLVQRGCACVMLLLSLSGLPAAQSHDGFLFPVRFPTARQAPDGASQLRRRPLTPTTRDDVHAPGIGSDAKAGTDVGETSSSGLAHSAAFRAKALVENANMLRQSATGKYSGEDERAAGIPGHRMPSDAYAAAPRRAQQALGTTATKEVKSVLVRMHSMRRAVLVRGAGTGATVDAGATVAVAAASSAGGRSASWGNAVDGLKNGVASGLAAAVVKTVLQPFDTMKTVQQFSTTR